jgi:PAS domain-containing protein
MYNLRPRLVPWRADRRHLRHLVASDLPSADVEEYRREGYGSLFDARTKVPVGCADHSRLRQSTPTAAGSRSTTACRAQTLSARLAEQNVLLRQHEVELQAQNANLDVALANMAHGLAMFDAEERLVVANDRYAEIYGLHRALRRVRRCARSSSIVLPAAFILT